jgi:hypothetical protein
VVPELAGLLPWPGGIRRGTTVAAVGCTSLLMTLLAGALRAGSWAAVVGLPDFGALAAGQDFGIDLSRLALVPAPGPDWPTVVAALIDGLDVVAVTAPTAPQAVTRALMARARHRGCVLLPATAWPGCDLTVELVDRHWSGLGPGHGRLRRQTVTLRATGRGRATRPATVTTTLPPPSLTGIGVHEAITPAAPAVPLRPPAAALTEETVPEWGRGLQAVAAPADPWHELIRRDPAPERRHS